MKRSETTYIDSITALHSTTSACFFPLPIGRVNRDWTVHLTILCEPSSSIVTTAPLRQEGGGKSYQPNQQQWQHAFKQVLVTYTLFWSIIILLRVLVTPVARHGYIKLHIWPTRPHTTQPLNMFLCWRFATAMQPCKHVFVKAFCNCNAKTLLAQSPRFHEAIRMHYVTRHYKSSCSPAQKRNTYHLISIQQRL